MYKRITEPTEGQCKNCKNKILFDHGGRRYCGDCAVIMAKESRDRAFKKRAIYRLTVKANRKYYHSDCRVCGDNFESPRKTRKYCGDKCKDKNFKIEKYMRTIIKCQDKIQELLTNK